MSNKKRPDFHVYYLPFTRRVVFAGKAEHLGQKAKNNISGFLYAMYMKHDKGELIKAQDGATIFTDNNGNLIMRVTCSGELECCKIAPFTLKLKKKN